MNLLRSITALGISSLTVLILGVTSAAAQGEGNISIKPHLIELPLSREVSYPVEITVSNTHSESYRVSFEPMDVEIDPQTHNVRMLPAESKRNRRLSLASWIQSQESSEFILAPGVSKVFPVIISPDREAMNADYYASLNFTYEPLQAKEQATVRIKHSLGTLLLMSVGALDGTPSSDASSMGEFIFSELEFESGVGEAKVVIEVENTSLRYASVRPMIRIFTMNDETVHVSEGIPRRIFPGEKTRIEQAIPMSFLSTTEALSLEYSLIDRVNATDLHRSVMALPAVHAAAGEWAAKLRGYFIAGIILVVSIICVHAVKHRFFQPIASSDVRGSRPRNKKPSKR